MASDIRPERSKAHRLKRLRHEGLKPPVQSGEGPTPDAVLDCGWGRLLFAQTFETAEPLVEALRAEGPDRRDIAFYVRNPHVLLAQAPQGRSDESQAALQGLLTRLQAVAPKGWLHARLTVQAPDHEGFGLMGSGMFVINPPYTLHGALSALLPWLHAQLAQYEGGGWLLDQKAV